ncbi:ankyrin repeat-containing domain protein [Aspergillus karnatakaensis]|uniref:ankyrin repeat-containing domain protein n=1 Tax=Aspergillus karnatakaensis TaxID=1810916 RepID=UPI003CCE465E
MSLDYLQLDPVRLELQKKAAAGFDGVQLREDQRDLLSYVVRYWPDHYKEGHDPHLTEQVVRFFKSSDICKTWWLTYMNYLWPPPKPDEGGGNCPLTVAARLGLDDVLYALIRQVGQGNSTSLAEAIVEAARGGNVQALRILLDTNILSEDNDISAALDAATANPDGAVLLELVQRQGLHHVSDQTAVKLPRSACASGLEEVVEVMIKLENKSLLKEIPSLHLAAEFDSVGVAKLLCSAGLDPVTLDENGSTPLHLAAAHGSLGVAKVLVGAAEVIPQVHELIISRRNNHDLTPLQVACQAGSHRVVQLLLGETGLGEYPGDSNHPLCIATCQGYKTCVQEILKYVDRSQIEQIAPIALQHSVDQNQVEIARLLLDAGVLASPSIEQMGLNRWTHSPLYGAASMGKLEMLMLLLEFEADVNQPEFVNDETPLGAAAYHGFTDIVHCLLDSNSNVNEQSVNGYSPLSRAAAIGYTEITKLLLDAGADPNLESDSGRRPLHAAYDHPEITRLLLEKGVDVNATCEAGSPLYLACVNNQVEVVKVLLEHDPKPDLYYERCTFSSLAAAIYHGFTDVVALLLKAKVDVNRMLRGRYSPLAYTVMWNHSEIVRMILEHQPDLNWKDTDGNGVLNYIQTEMTLSIVERLINRGIDPEISNKWGATAICQAVGVKNVEVVRYLALVVKVNLNPIYDGEGLLHWACRSHSPELAFLVADAGADLNLDATKYGTPLQAICWRKVDNDEPDATFRILQHLIDKGAQINTSGGYLGPTLNHACFRSTPEVIEFLIRQNADITGKDSLDRNAAHLVCYRSLGHYQTLNPSDDALVARDRTNRTALHYAVMSCDLELVKTVLASHKKHPEHRQNYIDLVDDDGWSPLHWAARTPHVWHGGTGYIAGVIMYLIEEGYDLTAKGKAMNQEWTPLDIAIYHSIDEDVKRLLIPVSVGEPLSVTQKHQGKKYESVTCDICFLEVSGFFLTCLTCYDFDLCFKCQSSRDVLHPDHEFVQKWPEYDEDDEDWQIPEEYARTDASPEPHQDHDSLGPRSSEHLEEVTLDFGDSDENEE